MIQQFQDFVQKSPTAFHAINNIRLILKEKGFHELYEGQSWDIQQGGCYFVTRNGSSIIAFRVGNTLNHYGFQIAASHSDSPSFKLKENAQLEVRQKYTQLNTEGYGGMICSSWLDRPLSIAGRAIVQDKKTNKLSTHLVQIDRDLVLIPNLAIHMNRQTNDGMAWNKQVDMLPLFGGEGTEKEALKSIIAEDIGCDKEDLLGCDLFLYSRTPASVWGAKNEFFSCGRIDDLECAFGSLMGFLAGDCHDNIQVFACFDNEEVGSGTKQGAASTFLSDTLLRVNSCLGKSQEDFYRATAASFLLSCDNAHAVHPNHPEKADANNCCYMNEGIVIKSHAGQKYTSDGVSIAIFKSICQNKNIPVQYYANRSDSVSGSTLGNISMSQLSMNAVDIGLAQLAMHSAYETAGVKDLDYLIDACKAFFSTSMELDHQDITLYKN